MKIQKDVSGGFVSRKNRKIFLPEMRVSRLATVEG